MNLQLFEFGLWLKKCENPCFLKHKMYFMLVFRYRSRMDIKALRDYSFGNVIQNDYDAIISRINHVQRSEESSLFIGF